MPKIPKPRKMTGRMKKMLEGMGTCDLDVVTQANSNGSYSTVQESHVSGDLLHYVVRKNLLAQFEKAFKQTDNIECREKSMILKPVTMEQIETIFENIGTVIKSDQSEWFYIVGDGFVAACGVSYLFGCRELRATIYSKRGMSKKLEKAFEDALKDITANLDGSVRVDVSWYSIDGDRAYPREVSEMISETVHPEAYPYIPNLKEFIDGYMNSDSSILLLMGYQGSGKTRLLRYIVQEAAKHLTKAIKVAYTSDMQVLDRETMFLDFRCDDYDFMILEDIDDFLHSRKNGNQIVHKFLASSDGFIAARHKKIILSTNQFIEDVDEALIRPGRCYACIETRQLNEDEAEKLAKVLGKTIEFDSPASVAEVYNAVFKTSSSVKRTDRKVGFGRK